MSSYNALNEHDRQRREEYAAMAPVQNQKRPGPPQNPHGEQSPNMAEPVPQKDGSKNPPLKDGSANPPKKTYGPGQAVTGQKPDFVPSK